MGGRENLLVSTILTPSHADFDAGTTFWHWVPRGCTRFRPLRFSRVGKTAAVSPVPVHPRADKVTTCTQPAKPGQALSDANVYQISRKRK